MNVFKKVYHLRYFEPFIMLVIITNCFLIGLETYFTNPFIQLIQMLTLLIFTLEIVIRYCVSNTTRDYFYDGWNIFDLCIVTISYIPESLLSESSLVSAIRVLRVFRILRLLRINYEIKLIISVLIKSFSALFYNGIIFSVFLYLYALIGFILFKIPDPNDLTEESVKQLTEYYQVAPNNPSHAPDPYGSLHESMFTLFRTLTGEDWTDLRYNLHYAIDYNLIDAPKSVVTTYHVSWIVLSAFLLLNLIVGAILNNYNVIMNQLRDEEKNA